MVSRNDLGRDDLTLDDSSYDLGDTQPFVPIDSKVLEIVTRLLPSEAPFTPSAVSQDQPPVQAPPELEKEFFDLLALIQRGAESKPLRPTNVLATLLKLELSTEELLAVEYQATQQFAEDYIEKVRTLINTPFFASRTEGNEAFGLTQKLTSEFQWQISLLNSTGVDSTLWQSEYLRWLVTTDASDVQAESRKLAAITKRHFAEIHLLLLELRSLAIQIVWIKQYKPELLQELQFADLNAWWVLPLFRAEHPEILTQVLQQKHITGPERKAFTEYLKKQYETAVTALIVARIITKEDHVWWLLETPWDEVVAQIQSHFGISNGVELNDFDQPVKNLILDIQNMRTAGWGLMLTHGSFGYDTSRLLGTYKHDSELLLPLNQEVEDLIAVEAEWLFDVSEYVETNPSYVEELHQQALELGRWFRTYNVAYTHFPVLSRLITLSKDRVEQELRSQNLWDANQLEDHLEMTEHLEKVLELRTLLWQFYLLSEPVPNFRLLDPEE